MDVHATPHDDRTRHALRRPHRSGAAAGYPALDIDGTREQLITVVRELHDALMSRP